MADGAIILGPGEGERVGDLTFKATGADGLGHFSFAEETLQPGAPGPPAHIHDTHDEAFYVVRGDLTMLAGERTVLATEGSFVFVPAGVVHGFANRSDGPVTFVFFHAPGGYEGLFRELEALRGPDGQLDVKAARALPPKYHDRLTGPPLGGSP